MLPKIEVKNSLNGGPNGKIGCKYKPYVSEDKNITNAGILQVSKSKKTT